MSSVSSSVSNSNYNDYNRVHRVICVIAIMTVSFYFAGCDFSYLGRCKYTSKTLYNCAFSVVLYALSTSIFETGLQTVSWKISCSAALTLAILFFFSVPISALVYIIDLERYLALLWLLVQGLIIIDIAHEVHSYIIKRADIANNFGGVSSARPWYLLHMGLSSSLFLCTIGAAYYLYSLCGLCAENMITLQATLSCAFWGVVFSLSEYCNKGCLIPAIVCCYSMLLCASGILSNPNTSCNTFTLAHVSESIDLSDDGKAVTNWLLLLTTVCCMVYSALTGSPSVIVVYKRLRSCVRPLSSTHDSCLTYDTHNLPLTISDHGLEEGLSGSLSVSRKPSLRGYSEKYAGIVLTGARTDEQNSMIAPSVKATHERDMMVLGTGGSGVGGESVGENTSLLRDSGRSSDQDFSPCSSKSADELNSDSALLFHIQLGLSACYLAVLLSDWTGIENSFSGVRRIEYLALEAMYLKLSGDYLVWILYGFVLLNSYHIYRNYNIRLRSFIRV